jgi:hypothetical protein
MKPVGILAHCTEGAALCFLTFCQEGSALTTAGEGVQHGDVRWWNSDVQRPAR